MDNRKYTIVVCSNFLNHYTLALTNELAKVFEEVYFVVGERLPEERKSMGFADLNDNDFVIKAYEDREKAREVILNADIVLGGGYKYQSQINERLRLGKLVYVDSERLFKNDKPLYKFLQMIYYNLKHGFDKKSKLLCVSAYAASDYNSIGLFKNRAYKWGYFSEALKYVNIDELIKKKKANSIVWAGRLINWKHPEFAVKVGKRLKDEGYDFEINIIGNGEMEDELKKMVSDYELADKVHLLGPMPPEKVRKYMEDSKIYLFTSDKGEGWGVVLNEAMNSGCAVVASYSTGSTPFVVKDKVNGLIYKDDDENKLYESLKYLLDNQDKTDEIGRNAYKSVIDVWNPEEAAKRLFKFVDADLKGLNVDELFKEDILSKADENVK